MNPEDFKHHLISIKDSETANILRMNNYYSFWRNFWQVELEKIKSESPRWSDEFYRHDYISVLTHKEIPVSLHLLAAQTLQLRPCAEHSYFDQFSEGFIKNILSDNYKKILSAGWLTVNKEFAKNKEGILFSRLTIQLSLKATQLLGHQAIIGPTRSDNGMAAKGIEWGGKSYGQRTLHNVPCEMIVMDHDLTIPLNVKERSIFESVCPLEQETSKAA